MLKKFDVQPLHDWNKTNILRRDKTENLISHFVVRSDKKPNFYNTSNTTNQIQV